MKVRKTIFILLFLCFYVSCFAQGYDRLVRQAETLLVEKKYEEALNIYEKAFKSGEYHFNDYYNVACAHALLGNPDKAFQSLDRAVEVGYLDIKWLMKDTDLESLRSDDRWKALLTNLQERLDAMEDNFPEQHAEDVMVDLPEPRFDSSVSVETALKNRRSVRTYKNTPLTLSEVSQLLWAGFGITFTAENMPPFIRGGLRTTPSAGALFPLDLYIVAWNVSDLPAGVYYYKSETHQLVKIADGDKREALSAAAFDQMHFETASAAIVYSAIFERNMTKYGQRGRERYVCMDIGHSAENIYLQAYGLNIGTCAIGAFNDIEVKKVVGMTKKEEPLYIMPLGKVE
jgi:SagB-type dehydrogenase family enzyme